MGRRAKNPLESDGDIFIEGKSHPVLTSEQREQQLVALAYDRAEKQLRDGTASAQVITHFLKLGTVRNEIELEKLKRENELLTAKTTAIESAENQEKVYAEAIEAMKKYRGITND